jgi:hypothetical protein
LLCKHGQACPAENFGTPDTWFFDLVMINCLSWNWLQCWKNDQMPQKIKIKI